jgi:hypothetical protein
MKRLTFKEVRDLFFEEHPQFKAERKYRKEQNEFSTDCRCYFCDFVEHLRRNEQITETQANKITLIG